MAQQLHVLRKLTRTGGTATAALMLVVGAYGCTGESAAGPVEIGPPASALHPDDRPSYIPVPVLDADATAAAEAEATLATQLLVTKNSTQTAWYDALHAHLTDNAAKRYQTVAPEAVPAAVITGAARLDTARSSGYLARVAVPTDAGSYLVLLQRLEADAPWRVERFTMVVEP